MFSYGNGRGISSSLLHSRGAALVELALGLPLVLSVFLLILWIGVCWNAKNSLISALGNGVRLGATRSEYTSGTYGGGKQLIVEINSWLDASPVSTIDIPDMLATPAEEANAYVSFYQPEAAARFGVASDFSDFPYRYLYSLAYVYQALEQSVGGTLKYPCTQPGCAFCYNLHPSNQATINWTDPDFDRRFVGVECRYYPDNVILTPLTKMLSIASGRSVNLTPSVTRSHTFTSNTGYDEVI